MSRHRLVKALDLEDELDDYQGYDEEDDELNEGDNRSSRPL
jgi:hypothetical protein